MASILRERERVGSVIYLDGWITGRHCPVCGALYDQDDLSQRRYLANGLRCTKCNLGRVADFIPLLYHGG